MKTKHHGAALALAAAGLFGCAPLSTTMADDSNVHCYGVNKCKGHGFVSMSEHACDAVGGKVGP